MASHSDYSLSTKAGEEEEEDAWGHLTPLSSTRPFRPLFSASRPRMLPTSVSFDETSSRTGPDSPFRRFPAMLANRRKPPPLELPRPAVRSISHNSARSFSTAQTPATPKAGGLLAPPGAGFDRFVRSLSCEIGELTRERRGSCGTSASSFNLTQLMKFKKEFRIQRRHSQRVHRRSFHAGASPVMPPRCRSPSSLAGPSHPPRLSAQLHHYHGSGSGSYTGLPFRPSSSAAHHRSAALAVPDTRRWSLASLPSSSGYGTPGSSAFSSQYSSTERLGAAAEEGGEGPSHRPRVLRGPAAVHTLGSADSQPSSEGPAAVEPLAPTTRPRSRSLTSLSWLDLSRSRYGGSPTKFMFESCNETLLKNNVYKERFPKAKAEMEERLSGFVERETEARSGFCDGSTRFLLHQLAETAADCLSRSREDRLSSAYFLSLNDALNDLLLEARDKAPGSLEFLSGLVRELLLMVARPARLLECLEFNPEEFYHWLELAEGQVRSQMGADAAAPLASDFPQYIIEKLGLATVDASLDSSLASSDASVLSASCLEPASLSRPLPAHRLSWTESLVSSTDSGLPVATEKAEEEEAGPSGWQKGQGPAANIFALRPPVEEDFESVKLVSNGAYGAVWLVRHAETRERFALKKLSKRNIMLRNQVEQVFAERDILTFASNPFVVSFYGSFETKTHLCMVMEYVEGGDCASLLKAVGVLPVETAKPYLAEAVLAIEYLHSYGIVHRDLKPDNLLITAMGHVKLTDFGLSKIGLMNRTTLYAENAIADPYSETHQFTDQQLSGTPEYIAPECILRQGYGKPVDWWALGIITYEFLMGLVPFLGNNPDELFLSIIQDDIQWGDEDEEEDIIDPEAKDLIAALLVKNPMERLGTIAGADEVKAHAFFADLDYRTILKQKAEFIPQLDSEEDTSYFDTRADRYNHEESDGEVPESPGPGGPPTPLTLREERSVGSLYWSTFNSPSPRHSFVGDACQLPGPPPPPARAQSALEERRKASGSAEEEAADSAYERSEGSGGGRSRASSDVQSFSRTRLLSSAPSSGACLLEDSSGESTGTRPPLLSVPAIHPEAEPAESEHGNRRRTQTVPLPRFAISCEADGHDMIKELSPVEEKSTSGTTEPPPTPTPKEKTKSSHGSPNQRTRATSLRKQAQHPVVSKSSSLHLVIPSSPPPGNTAGVSSPGGSSNSSRDDSPSRAGLPGILSLKPPVMLRKGAKGFGFTIRSVRVYLGEASEYYTIQHMISQVDHNSPAFEAGLRPDELITHVHGEPVQNLTHPQLMQRLFSFGDTLSLRTTPLDQTSIRVGAARKSAGKMARKKGYKNKLQRRVLESKNKRKASLLRRLSGKRTSGEVVPGHKPPLLPRSASSQDGGLNPTAAPVPPSQPVILQQRLAEVGSSPSSSASSTSSPAGSSPHSPAFWQQGGASASHRPSSLTGLRSKLAATLLKSPGRRKGAATMPLSPLARIEGASSADGGVSPPPSPQPSSCDKQPEQPLSSSGVGVSGGVKKTITRPRKSSDLGASESLLKAAADPESAKPSQSKKGSK